LIYNKKLDIRGLGGGFSVSNEPTLSKGVCWANTITAFSARLSREAGRREEIGSGAKVLVRDRRLER
jgi:hypothetical protein